MNSIRAKAKEIPAKTSNGYIPGFSAQKSTLGAFGVFFVNMKICLTFM